MSDVATIPADPTGFTVPSSLDPCLQSRSLSAGDRGRRVCAEQRGCGESRRRALRDGSGRDGRGRMRGTEAVGSGRRASARGAVRVELISGAVRAQSTIAG